MGGRAGGGASGGMGSRSRGGSFEANVMVQNANGETHQLTKSFKNLTQAQDWVDKVGAKFGGNNKTGFATYGSVDKVSKSGATEYDVVAPIDFATNFAKADAKAFKSGYK